MTRNTNSSLLIRLGTCGVVSAFGTAVLLPSLREWADANILWWLCFVLAAGVALGGGNRPLAIRERMFVAIIPTFFLLIYVVFRVFVLHHTIGLSGVMSDNPRFWVIIAFIMLLTWPFALFFSYSREVVGVVAKWMGDRRSEKQIKNMSRAIAATIGLIGGIGLLVKALGLN